MKEKLETHKHCRILSGPEKVLFKSTYDFSMNVLKVSEAVAQENAMKKVFSKRAMAKNLKFKF